MQTISSQDRIMHRSALTLRTYIRWMRRFYGYAIAFVVICVFGLSAYNYYVSPAVKRQSMFAMKYLDANVFTNQRFGDDPFAIKPFATGLQLEDGIQLVKSQVFCEQIVKDLSLNVTQYEIQSFGKRVDLYGSEPLDVALNIPDDASTKITALISADGKTATATSLKIDGDDKPTSAADISLTATRFTKNYAGKKIEISITPIDKTAHRISKSIDVVQTAQFTDVLTCTFSDHVVQRADDILNDIPLVYDRIWAQWNSNDAQKFINAVDKRLAVHTEALEKNEAGIEQTLRNGNTSNINLTYKQLLAQKATDTQSLVGIETEIKATEAVASQLAADKNADRPIAAATDITKSIGLQKAVAAYNGTIAKREHLRENAGTANNAFAEVTQQLKAMHSDIEASVTNHIASLRIECGKLKSRIAATDNRLADLSHTQAAINRQARMHKNIESQYYYLQGKRGNDPLAINNISEAVRVVAPASGTDEPSRLTPWIIAVLGLLLGGVVIPIAVIFIAFITDNHVRDRYDFIGINIPVIGQIPLLKNVTFSRRMRIKFNYGLKSLTPPDLTNKDFGKEAFLMLRSELDHHLAKFNDVPVCICTSFNPGSGKSYVAINTASAEAKKGKRVLLVDLDIRRASLSKRINSPAHGATSYLDGSCTDLDKLIVHDKSAGIDILPSGTIRPNPAELLEHDSLDEMFERLRQRYDYIFIDCAPIQLVTDTNVLARVASHTIFVARIGLLDRRQLSALKTIRDNNELPNMLLVLNAVDNDN